MATDDTGATRLLRRYGPIALVVALVVGVIAFVGGRGDDDDDGQVAVGPENSADLPLTFQEAEAQGIVDDIDWGPNCDTERGRLKVPVVGSAPCVEPWDESESNGGATAQGVTAEEIKIVLYKSQPDALGQALVADAGADTDPDAAHETTLEYVAMLEDIAETYGRKLNVVTIEATGLGDDATAAQADALRAIDEQPFAVVGGPLQTPAWWQELTNAGIVCVGGCALAEPWDVVAENAPYLWPAGTPEQLDTHLLEFMGKQLVDEPVSFGGDELNGSDRVYGWIQAETETGEAAPRNDAFESQFEEDYGAEIATRYTYIFDVARSGEIASTAIARMKAAGVTTIILSVDPLIPADITKEATAQNYFPEWVLGPSVLMDTTIFGRQTDPQQWSHMVGVSALAARGEREGSDSYRVYEWYYGTPPPVNSQAVLYPGPAQLLLGIQLAGPNLTPETFKEGLFRYPPVETSITNGHISWGEELWGRPDYSAGDDTTAIWWDADATGTDEAGNQGTGMLSYVDGGARHLPGDWPTDPLPFFDDESSVTVYTERPDAAPEYPPWPGSPAAG